MGDAAKGAKIFAQRCAQCHTYDKVHTAFSHPTSPPFPIPAHWPLAMCVCVVMWRWRVKVVAHGLLTTYRVMDVERLHLV